MRITNQYVEKIFWRTFKADDTVYMVGLREGSVDQGKTGTWVDESFPEIKVEIKAGNTPLAARMLVPPGKKYPMAADLVVTKEGQLIIQSGAAS